MTAAELRQLKELRAALRGSGLFCFERDGTFFLYREIVGGRNTKVLYSTSLDEFVRRAHKAITK